MTDDLVKRLRERATAWNGGARPSLDMDAADAIERLRQERDEWIERAFAHQDKCATAARDEIERLRAALEEGRRAIGDHFAPNDCYATGPLTGDPIRDLVECPACSFILVYDAALAEQEGKS